MKLDFTEFSYGYAFTENLIRASSKGPTSAPVFPNLVQEAQLGYDVKIDLPGVPLFFQFKLPELMVRHTAREIATLRLSGLSIPFFRMPLMRRDLSHQHAHLINLEKLCPNSVFYASPGADGSASFNSAYGRAAVHLQSVLFSPDDIGPLPDDGAHSVAYCPTSHVAWRCSKAKKIKVRAFEEIALAANDALAELGERSLDETTRQIRESVWSLIPSQLRNIEADLRQRVEARRQATDGAAPIDDRARTVSTDLLVLRELVRVGIGVDLLIAQPRDSIEEKK